MGNSKTFITRTFTEKCQQSMRYTANVRQIRKARTMNRFYFYITTTLQTLNIIWHRTKFWSCFFKSLKIKKNEFSLFKNNFSLKCLKNTWRKAFKFVSLPQTFLSDQVTTRQVGGDKGRVREGPKASMEMKIKHEIKR